MDYLDHPFDVSTGSSRRPTPTAYAHLRKWSEKDEKFVTIHTETELTDINNILNQEYNLQISNQLGQTLCRILGLSDEGWQIIKATIDGALHVALDGLLSDTQNLTIAKIDIATAADHTIVAATSGQKIHVVNLFWTAGGEVNITLKDGATAITGPLDFGATGEPRGVVIPLGIAPLVLTAGNAFVMTLDQAIQVSGFAQYYKHV